MVFWDREAFRRRESELEGCYDLYCPGLAQGPRLHPAAHRRFSSAAVPTRSGFLQSSVSPSARPTESTILWGVRVEGPPQPPDGSVRDEFPVAG